MIIIWTLCKIVHCIIGSTLNRITNVADPHFLNQPNYSWPLESSSGFSHLRPGVFHIPSPTQLKGWKKRTNKHGLGLAPSAWGGSLWHFLCILWANASVYSSENSHKATRNADLNSRVGQPGIYWSTGLTVAFLTSVDWFCHCPTLISWLTCSVDWSLQLPSPERWFYGMLCGI